MSRKASDRDRTTPTRAAEASVGVAAVLGVVLCCALPAVISGGVLATIGAWLAQPLVVVAGVALLGGAVAFAVLRYRR